MPDIRIRHIFISPDHRYIGHEQGQPGDQHMRSVEEVECVAGQGLKGDRFFGFKEGYKGQVTFYAAEVFEAACAHVGNADCEPWAMRRNVMTEGIDLNELIGREFEIQGVRFLGTEECAPCHWMDWAIGDGARKFLRDRGGLRARILSSGTLRCGDSRLTA
ncbi:MAG: molybdenum cofactor biosysynthesis protein [Xanthomonadales bacterium]|nr:molybdenum cofactor biosysynthesis protein [Xanthomonadales bacterium]NIX13989.1 molybdenum cofactor biosysynthesis protein [Xanthomonadales bacterium]